MRPGFWSLLCIMPVLLNAGEIYQTVDEKGQVTFTDAPAAEDAKAEKLVLPPGPSPESIKESEARVKAMRQAADKAEQERLQKSKLQTDQVRQAQKELAEAEARLRDARELKDSDRQSLAAGKRRIRPEYFERIEQAEAAVEAAKKKLRRARSGN